MLDISRIKHIDTFISNKLQEIQVFLENPEKKILTIIACHVDKKEKLFFLQNNISYLTFPNNDIIVVNSCDLQLNEQLQREISNKVFKYIEIQNNKWLDFGKWLHVLNTTDYSNYDFITFTNDSFLICNPILHFFNEAIYNNVDLYAYSSSTEVKYHYQSYLFIIKSVSVSTVIDYIEKYTNIMAPNAVFLEINLYREFYSKKCFLNLGIMSCNIKKNVFFNNNVLYFRLFNSKLLPFIKMKRIYQRTNQFPKYDFNLIPSRSYRVLPNDCNNVDHGVHVSNASNPFSQNKFNNAGLNPDNEETLC